MERCEQPECFEPEKDNVYPLCIGKDKPECEECQLRADWEPDDPYGVERINKSFYQRRNKKMKLNDLIKSADVEVLGFDDLLNNELRELSNKEGQKVVLSSLSPSLMCGKGVWEYYYPRKQLDTTFETVSDIFQNNPEVIVLKTQSVASFSDAADVLLISEDRGILNCLKRIYPNARVLTSEVVRPDEIEGAKVVGNLPIELIPLCIAYHEVLIENFEQVIGSELTIEDVQDHLLATFTIKVTITQGDFFDIYSPTRGTLYNITEVLTKLLDRSNMCYEMEVKQYDSEDSDYDGILIIHAESWSSSWTNSVDCILDANIPYHRTRSGKYTLGVWDSAPEEGGIYEYTKMPLMSKVTAKLEEVEETIEFLWEDFTYGEKDKKSKILIRVGEQCILDAFMERLNSSELSS